MSRGGRVNLRNHHLFLDPDGFFRGESERPRLLVPALIVFAVGLVKAGRGVYVSGYTASAVESGVGGAGSGVGYLLTIPSFLSPFVNWVLVTVVILGVCTYLGGEGEASKTLRIAGWYVPALLGGVVTLGVAVSFLGGAEPSGMREAIETQTMLRGTLESTEMKVLKYTLVAWQGFIWTFGVKHAQSLELRKAALPAGVVVLLTLAWDLSGGMMSLFGVFF